jgi:D-alanine-D-alanine ligase
MQIVLVHDRIDRADEPDSQDVLTQARAVAEGLHHLGHASRRLACTLDLAALMRELQTGGADLVFNLVESLEGQGRLIHLAPGCFDAVGLPYTGCRTEALFLTSNKLLAKQWLRAAGLPTPDWIETDGPVPETGGRRDWIIKSVWEHASIGLDQASVVRDIDGPGLRRRLEQGADDRGGPWFAEAYIDGREFNLGLLASPDGPEVLPPAEIVFAGYPPGMARIVDYQAKWVEDSFACRHTLRRTEFPASDQPLLAELGQIARACWDHFRLSGYARVDFRVDQAGRPWVLEVNANPCLSPDAGFAAALDKAGLPFAQAVARIIADALPPAQRMRQP